MKTSSREDTYAAWLNILGSDPVPGGPLEHDLLVQRTVAASAGDSERLADAYMDVLLSLAPVGAERAKELADALVEASRAHHIRHYPGMPLMIDGVDCSPESVRRLERSRDEYRRRYMTGDVSR